MADVRSCVLFEGLGPEGLVSVLDAVEEQVFAEGQPVFGEGDEGSAFYMVREGRVRITRRMPSGHRLIVAELGPGEVFGEMSLVTGGRRSGDCVFLTAGTLWRFSREAFEALGAAAPALRARMVANLGALVCGRLQAMTQEVAALLAELDETARDADDMERAVERSRTGIAGFLRRLAGEGRAP